MATDDRPTLPPDRQRQIVSINKQRKQYGVREMEREADSHGDPIFDPKNRDYGEDWG